jgi:hypothetical protein
MSHSSHTKKTSIPGVLSLVVYWIVFGLLGLFGPMLVVAIVDLDFFKQWEWITTAPPGTTELLGGNLSIIVVRTTSGQILSCNRLSGECWIPDINRSDITTECDYKSVAFGPLTHPPQDILDCINLHGGYGDYAPGYTALFIIDQAGNIWEWKGIPSGNSLIIGYFAPLFVIFGSAVGSGIWSVRRFLKKRSIDPNHFQDGGSQESKWVWVLVATPLIGLISIVLFISIFIIAPVNRGSQDESKYTSVASTADAQRTADVLKFQAPLTPNPSRLAYNFAAQCQSANWSSSLEKKIICSAEHLGLDPSVELLQIYQIDGSLEIVGEALQFTLIPDDEYILGEYPVWEITPGDHFLATLECMGNASICDSVFSVGLEQLQRRTLIGNWEVTANDQSVEIDVDLSRFTGDHVKFILDIQNYDPVETNHNVLLRNPRIENIPGK